jgi:hypothetical protein
MFYVVTDCHSAKGESIFRHIYTDPAAIPFLETGWNKNKIVVDGYETLIFAKSSNPTVKRTRGQPRRSYIRVKFNPATHMLRFDAPLQINAMRRVHDNVAVEQDEDFDFLEAEDQADGLF